MSRQYAVTNLVIDLQNLMTSEDVTHHDVKHSGGLIVSVPNMSHLRKEAKQRLKPVHEKKMTIRTKKYKTDVQQLGMSQEIIGQ